MFIAVNRMKPQVETRSSALRAYTPRTSSGEAAIVHRATVTSTRSTTYRAALVVVALGAVAFVGCDATSRAGTLVTDPAAPTTAAPTTAAPAVSLTCERQTAAVGAAQTAIATVANATAPGAVSAWFRSWYFDYEMNSVVVTLVGGRATFSAYVGYRVNVRLLDSMSKEVGGPWGIDC